MHSRSTVQCVSTRRLDSTHPKSTTSAKNDPTRGRGKPKSETNHEKKAAEAQVKVDRIGEILDRVHAQQKKTHLYDIPKQYKLAKLESKLLDEYKKAIDIRRRAEADSRRK